MTDRSVLLCLMRELWGHVSPRRRVHLMGLCGLMLVGTLAELASLGMVVPFLAVLTEPERIITHPWGRPVIAALGLVSTPDLVFVIALGFMVAAILSGVVRVALLWVQTRLGNSIGNDLGSEAYRRTLYQSYKVHTARNSSEVLAVLITKINTVIYFVVIPTLTLITSLLTVLAVVVFMFLINPKFTTLAFLGFGSVYFLLAQSTKGFLARDGVRVAEGQERIARVVQEGLGGIRDVLIDGLQETYFNFYKNIDGVWRRALANISIIGSIPRPIIEAAGLALIAIIGYLLASSERDITTVIPTLGALALAGQRLLPLVQQGYASLTSIRGGQAALRDVLGLLEQPMPAYSIQTQPAPIAFATKIEMAGIYFRYQEQGAWILNDLNLTISRGSRVGIIGATGSGKSTLLDVLMGLLPSTLGTLRVDDVVVNDMNHRAWQARIAHVPQTVFLADASISENIAFGVPATSIYQDRVRDAAKHAQISSSIEAWSDGYNTVVGERGVRLSGGQRQRIGIARALYKQADVIVFDEATSALDSDTERAVMDSIEALSRDVTVIIVAHRLTTLRNCDQIVEIRSGSVFRVGTYKEMIDRLA